MFDDEQPTTWIEDDPYVDSKVQVCAGYRWNSTALRIPRDQIPNLIAQLTTYMEEN